MIIGAGIAGASTAFWAARAGLSPVVLEALPSPAALTTPVATGAFRLQFDNLEETELVRESVDLILDFSGITGQDSRPLGVRQPGYVWATTSEQRAGEQRRLVALQHSWGQTDIEILSGDEARRRFPYLSPEVVQARYRAGDGFVDPRALTLGLLRASGAPVHTSCRVVSLRDLAAGGFDIGTSHGPVRADQAVIASGPFTAELAALAGVDLPLEVKPRHKVVVPHLARVPPGAPMTIDDDTGVHWRPVLSGAHVLDAAPRGPGREPVEDVPPDHDMAFRVLDPSRSEAAARISPFWGEAWRRGGVLMDGSLRAVHDESRPPSPDRANADRRAVGEHRILRARHHVFPGRRTHPGRPDHLPAGRLAILARPDLRRQEPGSLVVACGLWLVACGLWLVACEWWMEQAA